MESKRQHYINKIKEIAKITFNEQQKNIAIKILEYINDGEDEIEQIYEFLVQKAKVGLTFDSAPESFPDKNGGGV